MPDRQSGTVVIVGSRSGCITSLALPAPGVATGEVPEYAKLRAVANEAFQVTNGAENGDTKKAANAIVDVVHAEGVAKGRSLPDTLFLGSDALRDVHAKCRAILETLDEWEDVAISIDVDQ
ncbi:hypothetical protein JB92DRAFT_2941329 [Gautieria morchelliformis]|nr:hypothetical protein JB92DRAFT_2941329 [Gautieria morchelliformis]